MKWLDANIILCYLTGDDPVNAQACLALLQRVRQGSEELATSATIIAEVTYILTSQYALDHRQIAARLQPLLALRGLKLDRKRVVQRALERYAATPQLDFEDALSLEHMARLGIQEIVSYDRDFGHVSGVTLHEP